jgi:hypothetical protein
MSNTLITSRRQLNVKLYQNYVLLDDSFYKVYRVLRNYGTTKYAPFTPLLKNLNEAYVNLTLNDQVAQNFTAFYLRINQTVGYLSEYGANQMLMSFGMMTTQESSPPAQSIKMAMTSGFSTLFMSAMMRINPVTSKYEAVPDACVVKLFKAFNELYQPAVDQLLKAADNAVEKFPSLTTNHTIAMNNAVTNLRGLLSQIKTCVKLVKFSDRVSCVDQIVSLNSSILKKKFNIDFFTQYELYNCNGRQTCPLEESLQLAMQSYTVTMALNEIYPSYGMPMMIDFHTKLEEVKASCL